MAGIVDNFRHGNMVQQNEDNKSCIVSLVQPLPLAHSPCPWSDLPACDADAGLALLRAGNAAPMTDKSVR